jgi:hypothetical protein
MIEFKFNLAQDGEELTVKAKGYISLSLKTKKVICVLYMIGTSEAAYNKHLHEF